MIEVIDVPADNVIGLQMEGKVNKDDICKILSPIRSALEVNDTVNIYVEIDSLEGVSLGAIYEELKVALPKIHRFKKEAVVSDQASLKKWIKLGNTLWWGGEVKYFATCERQQALEWVQS
ncbi:MAG: STAS/SEC14 domain-containing protein [Pseudomonadales bacterium]|nr:STAS/SEC14 domain-containing protein [Pseudomonadales bacterium]